MKKDAPYFQLCKPNGTAPADESVVKFCDCSKIFGFLSRLLFDVNQT